MRLGNQRYVLGINLVWQIYLLPCQQPGLTLPRTGQDLGSSMMVIQLWKAMYNNNNLARSTQKPPDGMNDAGNLMPCSFGSGIKRVWLLVMRRT